MLGRSRSDREAGEDGDDDQGGAGDNAGGRGHAERDRCVGVEPKRAAKKKASGK
jgi:hypothetical protein